MFDLALWQAEFIEQLLAAVVWGVGLGLVLTIIAEAVKSP